MAGWKRSVAAVMMAVNASLGHHSFPCNVQSLIVPSFANKKSLAGDINNVCNKSDLMLEVPSLEATLKQSVFEPRLDSKVLLAKTIRGPRFRNDLASFFSMDVILNGRCWQSLSSFDGVLSSSMLGTFPSKELHFDSRRILTWVCPESKSSVKSIKHAVMRTVKEYHMCIDGIQKNCSLDVWTKFSQELFHISSSQGIPSTFYHHGISETFGSAWDQTKLAILDYNLQNRRNSDNLGNEIQSLAALNQLPWYDIFVDFWTFTPESWAQNILLLANGFMNQNPATWMRFWERHSTQWTVIFMGVHFASRRLAETHRQTLFKFAPIGARDLHTYRLLKRFGVPVYQCNCLTLSFQKASFGILRNRILGAYLAIDVKSEAQSGFTSGKLWERVASESVRKAFEHRTHKIVGNPSCTVGSYALMCALQEVTDFAHARAVATSRLHASLPTIAVGTPLWYISYTKALKDSYRFSGLQNFLYQRSNEESKPLTSVHELLAPPPKIEKALNYTRYIQECGLKQNEITYSFFHCLFASGCAVTLT